MGVGSSNKIKALRKGRCRGMKLSKRRIKRQKDIKKRKKRERLIALNRVADSNVQDTEIFREKERKKGEKDRKKEEVHVSTVQYDASEKCRACTYKS